MRTSSRTIGSFGLGFVLALACCVRASTQRTSAHHGGDPRAHDRSDAGFDAGRATRDDASIAPRASLPRTGPALDPPSSAQPDAPASHVRMLGSRFLPTCDAASSLRFFQEFQCEQLTVRAVRASGTTWANAALATDDSACTMVEPTAAPLVFEFEFDRPTVVHGLLVVAQVTIDPAVVSAIVELIDDQGNVRPQQSIHGGWQSNVAYGYVLDGAPATRRLRVRVTSASAALGWRELRPFVCDRQPSAFPVEPPPPPQNPADFVTLEGRGACRTDEDCVPDQCCNAMRCTQRAGGPACNGACPANEQPFDQRPLAGCFCNAGRCGSRVARRWVAQ
ncbi:MAG: hypothetical protein JNK05_08410 [Myxococcales bacterium]|nr:hypothetical protein [Myxococcales bacterium]